MQLTDIAFYTLLSFAGLIGLVSVASYTQKQRYPVGKDNSVSPTSIDNLRKMYPYIDRVSFDALVEVFTAYNALAGLPLFLAETKPAIRMDLHKASIPHNRNQVAMSRSGGGPDLPVSMDWPCNEKGKPLFFLRQMNLEDIAAVVKHTDSLLPTSGLLIFFYDYENQPWGDDIAHQGGWKVVYVPAAKFSELRYMEPPYPLRGNVGEDFTFTFRESFSMPSSADRDMKKLGWPEEYNFNYAFLDALQDKAPTKYFLGRPYAVQYDGMEGQIYVMTSSKGPRDWILLYQEATDFSQGYEFGDMGTLYFWIRKKDLARQNFDHVWVMLQCS